jgi:hypothetical protein
MSKRNIVCDIGFFVGIIFMMTSIVTLGTTAVKSDENYKKYKALYEESVRMYPKEGWMAIEDANALIEGQAAQYRRMRDSQVDVIEKLKKELEDIKFPTKGAK